MRECGPRRAPPPCVKLRTPSALPFSDYALSKPDTYLVSIRQLLGWMKVKDASSWAGHRDWKRWLGRAC